MRENKQSSLYKLYEVLDFFYNATYVMYLRIMYYES